MKDQDPHDEIETYGDPNIASAHAPIPKWLIATYIILPIWGIITFYYFWNGSYGWFDPGSWKELQEAANTTFPSDQTLFFKSFRQFRVILMTFLY